MDQPPPPGPKCLNCDKPMQHTRSTPRGQGFSEMQSFECKPCNFGLSQSVEEPLKS
jgi:transposase-like protein